MTIEALRTNEHLRHRIGVLEAFRDHHKGVDARFGQGAFSAMFDGALITCRSLWAMLGIMVHSEREKVPASPTKETWIDGYRAKCPREIVVERFTAAEFHSAFPLESPLVLCLVAANKCVAHLDEYPDHGATADRLVDAIEDTLSALEANVSLRP